ncbi:MAG: 30S ribosomal protein S6 [Proteobacteria bacterium]|nr:30S ribosomal protein S6 [Pseudomonadota bacterium]
MRKYETVVIFSQNLNDQELKGEVTKFQNFIESNQGTIVGIESWGKRELAYLIKKERFGSYICFRFDTDNHELLTKLLALLNITETVLYSQGHRLSDRVRKVKANPNRKPSSGEFEIQIGEDNY